MEGLLFSTRDQEKKITKKGKKKKAHLFTVSPDFRLDDCFCTFISTGKSMKPSFVFLFFFSWVSHLALDELGTARALLALQSGHTIRLHTNKTQEALSK
ncbi:hypothetical protein CEXT_277891 [Caerostris extrusa]|uniref:Uncharacterized protein n=1 Tax=Caerostris extrusa TaxID=172846 RepID=A0AAV4SKF5_CAEEX|nr:hypothetical protein CEXT_277891 [Caerostris extrusa]